MSRLLLTRGAAPSAPAASKGVLFLDAEGRVKALGNDGVLRVLSDSARSNWIRNGGFWFAQRQPPGTLTTYGATTARAIYGADGWCGCAENASAQYIRTDSSSAAEAGLQERFYGQFTKITNAGKLVLAQILEGSDAQALRGRTVRVQVWAKFIGGNAGYRLGLAQLSSAGAVDVIPSGAGLFVTAFGGASVDPTLGVNLARIAPKAGVTGDNCTLNGNAYDVTLTGAWQRFGGVFDVPSDCKNLIVMLWSNTQVTIAQGIALAQCSLTDGYELQDWSPQPLSAELARVLRYYAKTFAIDTAPVTNVGVNLNEVRAIAGKAGAVANSGMVFWRFPVEMRAAPSVVLYNPAAANALIRDITGAADLGATVATTVSAQGAGAIATGVAATAVGDQIALNFSADAEL